MEQFVSAPLPRDEKLALVDDWNCLRVSLHPTPSLQHIHVKSKAQISMHGMLEHVIAANT